MNETNTITITLTKSSIYCIIADQIAAPNFPGNPSKRKGHALSIHVPEYLKKYKSYYRYYKLEQMNIIAWRFAPVRPKSMRLWRIVEQYEMSNHVDKSLLAKRKRQTGKTMATTILTTIGLILFMALL